MKPLIIIGASIISFMAWAYFFYVSPESAKTYGKACTDWLSAEVGHGRPAQILDQWKRRGRIVFEVAIQKDTGSSASVYLCVVDPASGTMLKPGAFDPSWR